MSYSVSVNDDIDVDVDINYYFIDKMISKFNDTKDTTEEEAILLRKFLEKMLGRTLYNIDAYVESVDIDETDVIDIKENEISNRVDSEFDYKYKTRQNILQNEACIVQKLDQFIYNFGNTKELTKEDAKEIRNLLDRLVEI